VTLFRSYIIFSEAVGKLGVGLMGLGVVIVIVIVIVSIGAPVIVAFLLGGLPTFDKGQPSNAGQEWRRGSSRGWCCI